MELSLYSTVEEYWAGRGCQDVGALQRVHAGLGQVVHHRAVAHGRGVHAGENVQGLGALLFGFNGGQHAVAFQVAYGGNGDAGGNHGAGQAPAKVNAGQNVVLVGVHVANGTAQPTLVGNLFRFAGVPDVHGAEVGPVGYGVAHALDYGHLALVVQGLELRHVGVDAQFVIDGHNLVHRDVDVGPVVHVQRIGVRDKGVHEVVPAG